MRWTLAAACLLLVQGVQAQTSFRVTFDKGVREQPASGRLVVYLIKDGSGVSGSPADGMHWDNPQPMYGIDVKDLAPGEAAVVDDRATSFPVTVSKLEAGKYRVQAVLDMHRDDSDWKREPGNLYSDTASVRIGETDGPTAIPISLTRVVGPRKLPDVAGVEWFEVKSKLLSEFHGRDVMLRAGVALPAGYKAGDRKHAAVYEVPGFGGDHTGAASDAARRAAMTGEGPEAVLARNTFWIVLDPESGNGHTLFADSANNGPCGKALVSELIPALEAKYPLEAKLEARLLRGHSSGGWSTLWLALTYPETFGATWSTSPDPVDFRRMQLVDIYSQRSMYEVSSYPADKSEWPQLERLLKVAGGLFRTQMPDGPHEIASTRAGDKPTMSIRSEAQSEDVRGDDNTSGQQWDSWFAVWGPRNAAGHPAALFDPQTGLLDHAIAEQYRKYDIGANLSKEPARYAPLLQERCRVLVGDRDTYFLDEAVTLLKEDLAKHGPQKGPGYIKVLPGYDHGSIAMAPAFREIPKEMVGHLSANHLIK